MVQVGPNGPTQLDQTMLTNLNTNGGQPVSVLLSLGNPAAQVYSFSGQINSGKFSSWLEGALNLASLLLAPSILVSRAGRSTLSLQEAIH